MENKLYKVTIGSVEDGVDFHHFDDKTVVATDALKAAKRVRLTKSKRAIRYISSIELVVSKIDQV